MKLMHYQLLGYNVKGLGSIYRLLFPKHGIVFEVSLDIAYERRKEHPKWYYKKARKEYLKIAKEHNYPILKTDRPFEEVQKEINQYLKILRI